MNSDFDLSKVSWFGVGGKAEFFLKPKTEEELQRFLKNNNLLITVIGNGSNLLIRDGGVKGVVLKLGSGFGRVNRISDNMAEVGAGVLDKSFAMIMAEEELAGFEFLSTIPGNIGGGVKMNCGCFGQEISEVLELVKGCDFKGKSMQFSKKEINFGYRSSNLPDNFIITSVVLRGIKSSKSSILLKMQENQTKRLNSQPVSGKTCGSTFKNPQDRLAWQLLVEAGANKLKVGGAEFSQKHANFIINNGSATARDIEILGESAKQLVKDKFNINLEWEIKIIGSY